METETSGFHHALITLWTKERADAFQACQLLGMCYNTWDLLQYVFVEQQIHMCLVSLSMRQSLAHLYQHYMYEGKT